MPINTNTEIQNSNNRRTDGHDKVDALHNQFTSAANKTVLIYC